MEDIVVTHQPEGSFLMIIDEGLLKGKCMRNLVSLSYVKNSTEAVVQITRVFWGQAPTLPNHVLGQGYTIQTSNLKLYKEGIFNSS